MSETFESSMLEILESMLSAGPVEPQTSGSAPLPEGFNPARSRRGRSPFRCKGIRPLCICHRQNSDRWTLQPQAGKPTPVK
jgi:hypothetical protein